eukprot:390345-Rhodomonas_salina.1
MREGVTIARASPEALRQAPASSFPFTQASSSSWPARVRARARGLSTRSRGLVNFRAVFIDFGFGLVHFHAALALCSGHTLLRVLPTPPFVSTAHPHTAHQKSNTRHRSFSTQPVLRSLL